MLPKITTLNRQDILTNASALPNKGKLALSPSKLFYLKIDDSFIHQLFPLIKIPDVIQPDYFRKNSEGAHITVIYPEEYVIINSNDLNQEHSFTIKDFVAAEIGNKIYYVLLVNSPSLLTLRQNYGLSNLLSFKGYLIGLHITIGVNKKR